MGATEPRYIPCFLTGPSVFLKGSNGEVLHVFTMNGGLIAAIDLGYEVDTTGPTAAFAHRSWLASSAAMNPPPRAIFGKLFFVPLSLCPLPLCPLPHCVLPVDLQVLRSASPGQPDSSRRRRLKSRLPEPAFLFGWKSAALHASVALSLRDVD